MEEASDYQYALDQMLFSAVFIDKDPAAVELALKLGANPRITEPIYHEEGTKEMPIVVWAMADESVPDEVVLKLAEYRAPLQHSMQAAAEYNRPRLVVPLWTLGANLNELDAGGTRDTPYIISILKNHIEVMLQLDFAGANREQSGEMMRPPITNAIIAMNDRAVEHLLNKNVTLLQRDIFGYDACHYAEQRPDGYIRDRVILKHASELAAVRREEHQINERRKVR